MRGNTYWHRNQDLVTLGFMSYAEYLASELWAEIRRQAYEKHGSTCHLCPQQATCLHHISYSVKVLQGKDLSHIVPLCEECHKAVEFDCFGEKRKLVDAQKEFYRMVRKAYPGRKVKRKKRRKGRGRK